MRSGSDFDFAVRLALLAQGKKSKGIIGYYLNIGEGASSGGSHLSKDIQPVERTVVELRYGKYNKTSTLKGFPYVKKAKKYRLDRYLDNSQWKQIESYIPHYLQMMKEQETSRLAFEKEYRHWQIVYWLKWIPVAIV